MKKLSISLAVMGITSLGFAQNSYPKLNKALSEGLGTLTSNYGYLNDVQNGLTPKHVKYLENIASYWDVAKLEEFDRLKDQPLEVTFRSGLGSIVASYDSDGKIVTATERFKNVSLPKQLQIAIVKQYPHWSIVKIRYTLRYTEGKEPKKQFKVKIKKENQKKWVKVDSVGRIS